MKNTLALALVLAASPLAASAADLGYTYVEGGYAYADVDDLGNGDGFELNASVAVTKNVHLFGGYNRVVGHESGVSAELHSSRLGLGYNQRVGMGDLIGRVAYEMGESQVNIEDVPGVDSRGYSFEAGYRAPIGESIELWGFAGYGKVDSVKAGGEYFRLADDDTTYGRVGFLYKFNANVGLVTEGRFSDDQKSAFIGVRIGQ